MKREFQWINFLLWIVSLLGALIFFGSLGLMLLGVKILTSGSGAGVSRLDLVIIGVSAFLGLIITAGMQALRIGIAINSKAQIILDQLELLDVRIRGAIPQDQQLKQQDSLQNIVETTREMADKLDSLEKLQGNLSKSMAGYRLEGLSENQRSKVDSVNGKTSSPAKNDNKWRCPHCNTDNPGYLFKCRECGREIDT